MADTVRRFIKHGHRFDHGVVVAHYDKFRVSIRDLVFYAYGVCDYEAVALCFFGAIPIDFFDTLAFCDRNNHRASVSDFRHEPSRDEHVALKCNFVSDPHAFSVVVSLRLAYNLDDSDDDVFSQRLHDRVWLCVRDPF